MSKQPEKTDFKPRNSFGRRRGRRLSDRQQELVDTFLPTIALDPSNGEIDLNAEFPDAKEIHLEIGFGGGEHLLGLAKHYPDIGYIGCEPFINGMAKCVVGVHEAGLRNVRIYADDVKLLLGALPPASINRIYILFPDPWPKPRHHVRRLFNHALLDELMRIQPENGELFLATDHRDYSAWMLDHIITHAGYDWTAEKASDWQTPPVDWTQTRYQRKTTDEGREPVFLYCQKKA